MSNEPDVIREALSKLTARLTSYRRDGAYIVPDTRTLDDLIEAAVTALAAHDASRAGEEMHPDAIFALATKLALEVGYVLTPEPGFDDDDGDLNPSPPIQAAGVGREGSRRRLLLGHLKNWLLVHSEIEEAGEEDFGELLDTIAALLPQPDQARGQP